MRNKSFFLLILFVGSIHLGQAQKVTQDELKVLNEGNISTQFDFVLKKSSNYQAYKVVKRTWFLQLKKHVEDSLLQKQKIITQANNQILADKKEKQDLQTQIDSLKNELTKIDTSKNQISFLGSTIEKDTFRLIFGASLLVLLGLLIFFILKFYKSNIITQDALQKYNELEEEYNKFRATSLEREQALNRKLLDEINNNNN